MKIALSIIISVISVYAQNLETKLFSKLFTSLFNKKIIYVYTENPEYKYLHSIFLKNVDNCEKADIVIGVSKKCNNKPHFLLSYYTYMKSKNAIGTFYWRKGRPQLRLRAKALKKFHLIIAPEFKGFSE